MTVPFICLFIACLLPILLAMTGTYYRVQQFGKMDNKDPRSQSAQLQGPGARAVAAQSNAWEALAIFTAAVAVNHLNGGDPSISATLALVWLMARILHAVFYLSDLDSLRSLSFGVGLISALALFFV